MAADPEIVSQTQPTPPPGFTNVTDIPKRVDPFGVRPQLIDSIIHQESGGNPNARGQAGEVGLMQIMPQTAARYGVSPDQLANPEINRQVGTRYYSDLLKRYKGNEFLALVAYNSGEGHVDKGQLLPQSVKYAVNVLDRSRGGGPTFASQTIPTPGAPQQPSAWERFKRSLEGGFEGTAYAQETPSPPPGFSTPTAIGGGALPTPPKGFGAAQPFSMPVGSKMTVHVGPVTLSSGPTETTGEATMQEKLSDQRERLIKLGEEMQDLYDKRISQKLKTRAISSTGQGLEYVEPGPMRQFGYNIDPDVEDWIVKSGQFAQALNSYYASTGGGRGGVSYYGEVTSPHTPHPPSGYREVFGIWSPTGAQWDLQKQGEQLPILMHNLKRDQGLEGKEQYQGLIQLPSGKLYDPSSGQVFGGE